MVAHFIQEGKAIDHTPSADIPAGEVVVLEDLVGVTTVPIKANTLGALVVDGVFEVPKETGAGKAIAKGKTVYWSTSDGWATTASAGNKLMGKAVNAAADNDATVQVRLSQ